MHRYPARVHHGAGHSAPGPWLDLIHATNQIDPESFGNPGIGTGAGEYIEEYPRFRVVFHADNTVTVSGKTPEAEALLDRAAATLVTS